MGEAFTAEEEMRWQEWKRQFRSKTWSLVKLLLVKAAETAVVAFTAATVAQAMKKSA